MQKNSDAVIQIKFDQMFDKATLNWKYCYTNWLQFFIWLMFAMIMKTARRFIVTCVCGKVRRPMWVGLRVILNTSLSRQWQVSWYRLHRSVLYIRVA